MAQVNLIFVLITGSITLIRSLKDGFSEEKNSEILYLVQKNKFNVANEKETKFTTNTQIQI